MPPRERPPLQGAELDLFDLLLSAHVRYMAHRMRCFDVAVQSGVSEQRSQEIARLVLIYAAPRHLRANLDRVLATVEQLPTVTGEKPS